MSSNETSGIEHRLDEHGIATIQLSRPAVHNALDYPAVVELTMLLPRLAGDLAVRVIVISGAGASFCSGTDANWMREMADVSEDDNHRETQALAELFRVLRAINKPLIARVHGNVLGIGVGICACADMVVATETARFGFPEARVGLVPATVAPHIVAAVGLSNARYLFLRAESISCTRARAMGLVHDMCAEDELDAAVAKLVNALLQASPAALGMCKALVDAVAELTDQSLDCYTSDMIAKLRMSAEGQEGLSAFLEKRKPSWAPD